MIVPLRITGGFVLLGLGVAGLMLPIMPGLIFLIPGLALLRRHFDWAHRLHCHLHGAKEFCWQKVRQSGVFGSRSVTLRCSVRPDAEHARRIPNENDKVIIGV